MSEEIDPLVGQKVVKIAFTHHDAGVVGGPTNNRPGPLLATRCLSGQSMRTSS
jgi:hypothetical protein